MRISTLRSRVNSKARELNFEIERATAENFVRWFERQTGRRNIVLSKHEAPDFFCKGGHLCFGLEITTCTYNEENYRMLAKWTKGPREGVACSPLVKDPEHALAATINDRLNIKCLKNYGDECYLIIRIIRAPLTSDRDFREEVLPRISVPDKCPFREIYLTLDQRNYFPLIAPSALHPPTA